MTLCHWLLLLAVVVSGSFASSSLGFACYVGTEFSFPDLPDNSPRIRNITGVNASSAAIPTNCNFNETACSTVTYTNLKPGLPARNTFLEKTCLKECLANYKETKGLFNHTTTGNIVNITQADCCNGDLCNSNGTLTNKEDKNGSNKDRAAGSAVLLLALLAPLLSSPSRP